jgi:SEC-C motif-containing protein
MGKPAKGAEQGCPCSSGAPLADCCAPYLDGTRPAPTAEALMRSRYSAYALGRGSYLKATWHPSTRPANLHLDPGRNWLGLKVLRAAQGAQDDDRGVVEFVARFKVAGRGHRLHEISRFEKLNGRWLYLDGERGSTDSSLKS